MINTTKNGIAQKIGNWFSARLDQYEIILFMIFITALIVKSIEDLQSDPLIVVSLSILAVLCYFAGHAVISGENVSGYDKFVYKLAFWASSIGIIGILFRLMGWEMSYMMITIGCLTLAISLVVIIFLKSKKDNLDSIFSKRFILRMVLIGAVGILLNYVFPENEFNENISENKRNEKIE